MLGRNELEKKGFVYSPVPVERINGEKGVGVLGTLLLKLFDVCAGWME